MSSIQPTTPTTTEQTNAVTTIQSQQNIENFVSPAGSQRFTKEEKALLYELFKQNEEIIDIKHRKNSSKKITSVRECWERISAEYNDSVFITTKRNMKQIQKFWLNARLRKNYPATNDPLDSIVKSPPTSVKTKRTSSQQQDSSIGNVYYINVTQRQPQQVEEYDEHQIEQDQHHQIQDNQQEQHHLEQQDHIQVQNQIQEQHQVQETSKDQNEFIENIKFENMEPEIETEVEMIDEEEIDQVEVSTSSNDVEMDSEINHQQYTIDHISAEKLTLNDLLEFKNSRSHREEIVLQIKSNDPVATTTTVTPKELSNLATYVTPYRITNSNINNSPAEHHTQYQSIQQVIQTQAPHINSKPSTATVMITQQSPHHQQTSCCNHQTQKPLTPSNSIDNLEEKLNFYKLKGAELRYKEEQLRWEQSKIDLQRAKEQLKHMKEMHAFQIEEMKLKVKTLMEEENRSKTKIIVKKH